MNVDDIRDEIAHHLQDPAKAQVNNQQLLEFLNSAARDAGNEGVVIPLEDDESLTLIAADFDYAVPTSFAYIHEINMETGVASGIYTILVPWARWRIIVDAGVPQILFSRDLFTITAGLKLKLRGHKRPVSYTDGAETVDIGLESFLRERAAAYGARFLTHGQSQRARTYDQMFQDAWQASEGLLQQLPETYRPNDYSQRVLLR